jgi:hypothetical protein
MTFFAENSHPGSVKGRRRVVKPLLLIVLYTFGPATVAAPSDSLRPADVITHLEQVMNWYRDLNLSEPLTGDLLVRDELHQASLTVLQLAFQFARAEGALIAAEQIRITRPRRGTCRGWPRKPLIGFRCAVEDRGDRLGDGENGWATA